MYLTFQQQELLDRYLAGHEIPAVRIAVLGQARVGKRSMLCRFCEGHFLQTYIPHHNGVWERDVLIRGRRVHVCWETPNLDPDLCTERMHEIAKHGEACMMVYDVTNPASFNRLEAMHLEYYSKLPEKRGIPTFVVAQRTDRPRTDWGVSLMEGDQFSEARGAMFLPLSAKTGSGAGEDVVISIVTRVLLSRIASPKKC